VAALVALITARIVVIAARTFTLHESISEKGLMLLVITKRLLCSSFVKEPVFMKLQEDVLCDGSLLVGSRSSKIIKSNVEPIIDFFMLCVKLIAQLLWCLTGL
jgi:hypothetical protein